MLESYPHQITMEKVRNFHTVKKDTTACLESKELSQNFEPVSQQDNQRKGDLEIIGTGFLRFGLMMSKTRKTYLAFYAVELGFLPFTP